MTSEYDTMIKHESPWGLKSWKTGNLWEVIGWPWGQKEKLNSSQWDIPVYFFNQGKVSLFHWAVMLSDSPVDPDCCAIPTVSCQLGSTEWVHRQLDMSSTVGPPSAKPCVLLPRKHSNLHRSRQEFCNGSQRSSQEKSSYPLWLPGWSH